LKEKRRKRMRGLRREMAGGAGGEAAPQRHGRMEGIFCANFCEPRGSWAACRKVWHAECYECLGQGKFPIKKIQDEEGNRWYKHDRYPEALQRNNYTECDECH
jgi:hypothetical protein